MSDAAQIGTAIRMDEAGNKVPGVLDCGDCGREFMVSVFCYVDEIVTCPHCGAGFLTFNDCRRIGILDYIPRLGQET